MELNHKFKGNKILVTGGAGAIGSNITKVLLDFGAYVDVIDDLTSGYLDNVDKRSNFMKKDISKTLDLDDDYDYIIHCAAFFANQNSVDHPVRDLEVNGIGTINVLNLCKNQNNLKGMIYLSSSCVYGPRSGALSIEDEIKDFDTPYAISKFIGEKYCEFYKKTYNIPIKIVRLFNSYGPGEMPGKYRNVIPNFFKLALNGQPLTITGTGDETRDFTYVLDTVYGILETLVYDGENYLFNLGTGIETSIIKLATEINKLTQNESGIEFVPRRSWDHISVRKADIKESKVSLNYNPTTPLCEGLKLAYEWIKEHNN
ncbi:MAG: NAD-dependent epimerase/dehydratase family protein [Acidaminobacteraceae bacterium]